MNNPCLGLALAGVSAVSALSTCPAGSATTPASPVRVNYARPFEPPTRPAFLPLPPGAVEPAGWLRDWCLAARDGFIGHLDEDDDEFKRAWAPDHKMTGPEQPQRPKGGHRRFGGLAALDLRPAGARHDGILRRLG